MDELGESEKVQTSNGRSTERMGPEVANGKTSPSGARSFVDRGGRERPLLAFFIPDLSLGGAEQVTVNIVNGLVDRGYDVDLLLSRFEGQLHSQLDSRITVVELPPARTPVIGVAAHLPALVGYLRRKRPAALFPHLSHVSVVCLAASMLPGLDTPVVPTHHKAFGSAADRSVKDRVVRGLVRRAYPAAERIIAVSEGVADSIVDGTPVERSDVSVLHNPVQVEAIRERAREPVGHEWIEDESLTVILFVGRIEPQKDLETWLRAFETVSDDTSDLRAVIAGQGSCREDLLSFAEGLGIGDVVSMPGYVENPYRYMARASVFLLSSRFEGLPTVLIEALACGCPIVATDCPSGPREILDHGEYGHLVPVGDSSGLAAAVEQALADPTSPDRLRTRANEFAPAAVFEDYERFIEEYLVPKPS